MSIVLIGGHERMYERYIRLAKKRGHKLKVMSKMKTDLTKRIGSPDGIIVFTSTVSHKMVVVTDATAKKKEIPIIRCHTSSQNAFESTMDILEEQAV
jgi:hypothetical protein